MTQPPERGWLPAGEFQAPPADYYPPYYPPTGDVEFYEVQPGPYPSPSPLPYGPPGWDGSPAVGPTPPLSPLVAGASFLWAGCAFGALIGPFLTFGSYQVNTVATTFRTTLDGWGRYSGSSTAGHGVIWGIPLIFCAAMLAIAVLGVAWRRAERWPAVLGLIGCVALVTTALGAALDAESRASATGASGLTTANGDGLWLTVYVGLAAAVAGLMSLRMVLDAPLSCSRRKPAGR